MAATEQKLQSGMPLPLDVLLRWKPGAGAEWRRLIRFWPSSFELAPSTSGTFSVAAWSFPCNGEWGAADCPS